MISLIALEFNVIFQHSSEQDSVANDKMNSAVAYSKYSLYSGTYKAVEYFE